MADGHELEKSKVFPFRTPMDILSLFHKDGWQSGQELQDQRVLIDSILAQFCDQCSCSVRTDGRWTRTRCPRSTPGNSSSTWSKSIRLKLREINVCCSDYEYQLYLSITFNHHRLLCLSYIEHYLFLKKIPQILLEILT